MYSLSVKNSAGERLNLSSNPNYTVYKIDGLTPPKATINRSTNATHDGSVINSASVEDRNIVIYLTIDKDAEANRIKLYKYFTPKNKVTLYFKNGARNVYIEGTVELLECDIFSNKQIAQISIICPKVYFKDVEHLISYFSEIKRLFEFPFSIDPDGIELSSITPHYRKNIIYTGDVDTGVIISLFANGTVVNPIIYDALKKTKIQLNMTLKKSDEIIINTNAGDKAITLIRDGISTNALGYMTPDSSWFTLQAGDNVFTYTSESGSSNIDIIFTTPLLYGGV